MQFAFEKPQIAYCEGSICFDAFSISICQNPNLRSRHEKCPAPTRLSNASLNSQQGVGVLFHMCIQAVEVNTEL